MATDHDLHASTVAAALGCTQSDAKQLVRLSFCRVAEYQRRGIVHLHAVIPADGPEQTLPVVSPEQLVHAALRAANGVTVVHPRGAARWGQQIDAQVLERSEKQRAKAVASYVAKYATKSSDDSGALDVRIRSEWDLAQRRLPATCTAWPKCPGSWGERPPSNSGTCVVMPTASGTEGTSSPSPTGTRRHSGPCVPPAAVAGGTCA